MVHYPSYETSSRRAWRRKYGRGAPARQALLAELAAALADVDRLVVKHREYFDDVLFESRAAEDIDSLRDCLILEPSWRASDCMCSGSPVIQLFAAERLVIDIRNLHSTAIRCSLWEHPVALRDTEKWVSWFDVRHIDGPGVDPGRFTRPPRRVREPVPALTNWFRSMPQSLASRVGPASLSPEGVRRVRIVHERAVSDRQQRVRELLEWFGSGTGPWSGYPAWEMVPEQLLCEYPFATIVAAIRSGPLNARQTEGAARLFASWSYQPRFTHDVANLPSELKSQLWEHVRQSDDQDKRQRAARAFGGTP